MPFTLAHPAAVIPIFHGIRRHVVLSALVIGSLIPDVWNLAPDTLARTATHSMVGVLWPCLPLGLAAYAFFHLALKRPAAALLPAHVQRRLAPMLARPGLPPASFWKVVASLLLGAATHVAWDSFTHAGGRLVEALPFLQQTWFRVGRVPFPAYRVIQHASTLLGLVAVWLWVRRSLREGPPPEAVPGAEDGLRVAAVSGTLGIAFGYALHAAMLPGLPGTAFHGLFPLLRRATIAGLEGLLLALLAWSVAWHLVALRGRRQARH